LQNLHACAHTSLSVSLSLSSPLSSSSSCSEDTILTEPSSCENLKREGGGGERQRETETGGGGERRETERQRDREEEEEQEEEEERGEERDRETERDVCAHAFKFCNSPGDHTACQFLLNSYVLSLARTDINNSKETTEPCILLEYQIPNISALRKHISQSSRLVT